MIDGGVARAVVVARADLVVGGSGAGGCGRVDRGLHS